MGKADVIRTRTAEETISRAATTIKRTATELVGFSDRVRDLRSTIQSRALGDRTTEPSPVVERVVSEVC